MVFFIHLGDPNKIIRCHWKPKYLIGRGGGDKYVHHCFRLLAIVEALNGVLDSDFLGSQTS